MSLSKIKVVVVDDSAVIRSVLTEIIEADKRLKVVGTACDPFEAREVIKATNPDVITLDIEMPKMNGITFLKNLMRLRPTPVIMISTLTQEGAPATFEALACGAVDFLGKPKDLGGAGLMAYQQLIAEKIFSAATANVRSNSRNAPVEEDKETLPLLHRQLNPAFICAMGASTGGTEAIKNIIKVMPADAPPIVIAQHIPDVFSTSFAKRLDSCSAMTVFEAEHNQWIERGCAYLAPGHSHLRIVRQGARYLCRLDQGELVNRHRPSVEVLFDSVREAAGEVAMGVILTGMGADGSAALLRMREAGCLTIAQDEATSVVWGMPGVAVKLGAADKVLPLDEIAKSIVSRALKA
jgi:two-component system, chemotaxis family, protein-glutamate methylesterase/glutaminase